MTCYEALSGLVFPKIYKIVFGENSLQGKWWNEPLNFSAKYLNTNVHKLMKVSWEGFQFGQCLCSVNTAAQVCDQMFVFC